MCLMCMVWFGTQPLILCTCMGIGPNSKIFLAATGTNRSEMYTGDSQSSENNRRQTWRSQNNCKLNPYFRSFPALVRARLNIAVHFMLLCSILYTFLLFDLSVTVVSGLVCWLAGDFIREGYVEEEMF